MVEPSLMDVDIERQSNLSFHLQVDYTGTRQRSDNMAWQFGSVSDIESGFRRESENKESQVASRGASIDEVISLDYKDEEENGEDCKSNLEQQRRPNWHYSWTSADEMGTERRNLSRWRSDSETSFSPITKISREVWRENVDLDFLDDIALVSSDDEIDFKKKEMTIDEYESKFFKLFHDVLRKNKLMLNSQLPRWEQKGMWCYFKSQGAHVRQVAKLLQKCHKTANRCFNFQRNSFLICSESHVGKCEEEIELCKKDIHKIFKFQVDRYSAIDCLCMFDFSAICQTDSNFLASTNSSPYLSLTLQQWRHALKEERIGRAIMMYEPSAVELLQKQGKTAQKHARELERTHYMSKLLKLVITEFVYINRHDLRNNTSFKGSDVIKQLKEEKKNKDLFKAIPKWVTEFEQYEFVLNPLQSRRNWLDLISDESPITLDKFKSSRKTILLCDPVHWTLYMMILVDERVQALISLLAGTAKVKKGWEQNNSGTDTEAQIRDVKTLGKEHLAKLRKLLSPLPTKKSLEAHAARNQDNFFIERIDTRDSKISMSVVTRMIRERSDFLDGRSPSPPSQISSVHGSSIFLPVP